MPACTYRVQRTSSKKPLRQKEREGERDSESSHVVRDNISGHLRELVANIGFERTTFILFLIMFVLFYSLSPYS